ncbi:MAG: adenosylcobalamin-dependent ribonucleoside-diphosphate reductase [Nitrososphaerota archaeon]|nr:adenosylcobalamin-dependent ribonucleoside-diphosphate reductase [Nitrososphaerota archaeon]
MERENNALTYFSCLSFNALILCVCLKNYMEKKVVKRDGRIVDFDPMRIKNAVAKAMTSMKKYDENTLEKVVDYVLNVLNKKYEEGKVPHVEEIQDIVELALVKFDLYEVAKAYILYRKERERIREEKKTLLQKDFVDEVEKEFSINAIRLMVNRYLLKDENGKLMETPKQMFQRVAMTIVIPDILYDPKIFHKDGGLPVFPKEDFDAKSHANKIGLGKNGNGYSATWNEYHLERMKALYDELNSQGKMKVSWSDFLKMLSSGEFENYYENFETYYRLMVSKKFMPNSPTLFNAGTRLGQLSACFVLDIDDNIESIMNAATQAAIIFKSGGGVGINYSKLRPSGDIVSSTSGVASGPVSFMRIIDTITDVVKQGGKRRGANMGILEIDHPDIESFITSKSERGKLENFNISVLIKNDFWNHVKNNDKYPLVNPRDGRVWKTIDARDIFRKIAEMAWRTGDPGVIFFDNINKRNILAKTKGPIKSTNPCGEEPLYPYESCNLGSINLYSFIRREGDKAYFDWDDYDKTVRIALRFLDNVIDVNKFPIPEIERETKMTRKVGLGVMGLADMLFALRIPYNSEEGFNMMNRIAEHLTFYAMKESCQLSKERGSFPLYSSSSYPEGEMPIEGFYHEDWQTLPWRELQHEIARLGIRNAEVTTIAPTGSISMLVDVSSGIEPQFALIYEKRITIGTFYYVDVEFEKALRDKGLYDEKILKLVSDNGGSLVGLNFPEELANVFLVAYDIPWWDHIRAQAEFTKWICAAVSKTINMPNWVTAEDVQKAFMLAHAMGVKGVTVYRDGTLPSQVLVTPSSKLGKYMKIVRNSTIEIARSLGIEIRDFEENPSNKPLKTIVIPENPILVLERNEYSDAYSECPNCSSRRLVKEGGCLHCLDCGWSMCPVA